VAAIRLLVVLADADASNGALARWAVERLERPAFAPRLTGPEAVVRKLELPVDVPRLMWRDDGWRARREGRRLLANAVADADAVLAVGYRALDAVGRVRPVGGVVVYARTTVPSGASERRLEAYWMARADARWAAERPDVTFRRASPPREALRKTLGVPPDVLAVALGGVPSEAGRQAADAALSAVGAASVLLDLRGWGESGGMRRLAVSDEAVAAADLLLVPDAAVGEAALVDAAMQAGVPVVASPAPAHVGRFRCPGEGFLVPLETPEAWAEVAAALAGDIDFRQAVGDAARRRVENDDQRARELGSVIAGALVLRTGRCPVCPDPPESRPPSGPAGPPGRA